MSDVLQTARLKMALRDVTDRADAATAQAQTLQTDLDRLNEELSMQTKQALENDHNLRVLRAELAVVQDAHRVRPRATAW